MIEFINLYFMVVKILL